MEGARTAGAHFSLVSLLLTGKNNKPGARRGRDRPAGPAARRRSGCVIRRRAPAIRDELIARARLPARDHGPYLRLNVVRGLVRVLPDEAGSVLAGAKALHAANPALQGPFHGSASRLHAWSWPLRPFCPL